MPERDLISRPAPDVGRFLIEEPASVRGLDSRSTLREPNGLWLIDGEPVGPVPNEFDTTENLRHHPGCSSFAEMAGDDLTFRSPHSQSRSRPAKSVTESVEPHQGLKAFKFALDDPLMAFFG